MSSNKLFQIAQRNHHFEYSTISILFVVEKRMTLFYSEKI